MRIEIVGSQEELARRAAGIVCEAVRERPNVVLGLASGATPLGLYAELPRRASETDFSGVAAFAVDELLGVPRVHRATNASYFREHPVPKLAITVLDSETNDPVAQCARFSRLIDEAGGLDLVVLGIGRNGHLAFNEPGSPFDSRCRPAALDRSTREIYAPHFGSLDATPAFGLTLGIADLLAARRVLLLAIGDDKAEAVAQAIEGPATDRVPASALQRHDDCTVLLDHEASARLSRYAS